MEKSFFNPLYQMPKDLSDSISRSKKRKSKLEKFYSRNDLFKESVNDQRVNSISNGSYNDQDEMSGIYQNPLYGIKSESYDANEETGV